LHPDFAVLDAGVERLSNIAIFLNEKKREAEALQRTFHVQEILDKGGVNVQVATGSRRYLHEGELYDGQGKAIVVYLFNDLIVICGDKNDRAHTEADERRANRKKIKLSEFFELEEGMTVTDVADDTVSGKYSFLIRMSKQNRSVFLTAASAAIKKDWMEILRAVQVKLSTLAMLHMSEEASVSGSPSLNSTGARTVRNSKRSDSGTRLPSHAHRRSKSKVDDITQMLQRRSDAGLPDISTSHDSVPALPEKKRGFFPLASPRSDRHAAETSDNPSRPEKSSSKAGSSRKAKLGAVPSASDDLAVASEGDGAVTPLDNGMSRLDDAGSKKGSIRIRLGAVMKFTKLWDKDKDGNEDEATSSGGEGSMLSPDVRRPSMESTATLLKKTDSGDVVNSPLSKRETELAMRTDSHDMAKLGKLMRGRSTKRGDDASKDNDGELGDNRDSGTFQSLNTSQIMDKDNEK
jgi:hypothetical protein